MELRNELALSTRFLEAYNHLDDFMRKTLNARPGAGHSQLLAEIVKQGLMLETHLLAMEGFARLRNAIVHNPLASDARPIAEPHFDAVQEYEGLVSSVLVPSLATTIAISLKDIFSTGWSGGVLRVVETMRANVYTHVPVLEDGRITGIFSESTLSAVLAARRHIAIDQATTISELREFVPLSGGISEVFEFLSVKTSVPQVVLRFKETFRERRRLGAVFLTGNGDPADRLCGLITAWDVTNKLAGGLANRRLSV